MKLQNEYSEEADYFKKIIKGVNFMTPNVVGYIKYINGVIELSSGKYINNEIFGVTVVEHNLKNDFLCKFFNTYTEATEYIDKLIKESISPLDTFLEKLLK